MSYQVTVKFNDHPENPSEKWDDIVYRADEEPRIIEPAEKSNHYVIEVGNRKIYVNYYDVLCVIVERMPS